MGYLMLKYLHESSAFVSLVLLCRGIYCSDRGIRLHRLRRGREVPVGILQLAVAKGLGNR